MRVLEGTKGRALPHRPLTGALRAPPLPNGERNCAALGARLPSQIPQSPHSTIFQYESFSVTLPSRKV